MNLDYGIIQKRYTATIVSGDNEYIQYPVEVTIEHGEVNLLDRFTWATIRQVKDSVVCGPQLCRNPVFENIKEAGMEKTA